MPGRLARAIVNLLLSLLALCGLLLWHAGLLIQRAISAIRRP